MVTWEQPPLNADQADRRYNLYTGRGSTGSEFGVGVLLSRMCEFVMGESIVQFNPLTEQVETWVCVDRRDAKRERKAGVRVSVMFNIHFLTVYPPPRSPERIRHNDLFILRGRIWHPEDCPFYTDVHPVFAERLLRKTAQRWVESWDLRERVEGSLQPRPKWPVKLWVHKEPGRVWRIADDGALVELSGHPTVDETMMDPPPKPPAPATPTDLSVAAVTPEAVTLRWRAVADADRYLVEWSVDGQPFSAAGALSAALGAPGPDGFYTYRNELLPEIKVVEYRVLSARGPAGNFSEPTPPVRVQVPR